MEAKSKSISSLGTLIPDNKKWIVYGVVIGVGVLASAAGFALYKKCGNRIPQDKDLKAAILKSLKGMKKQKFGPEEEKLVEWIRTLKPAEYSIGTRIHAAEWIILFHNQGGGEQKSPKLAPHDDDFKKAWQLLDCRPNSDDEARALDMLKLNIGQHLQDKDKMLPAYSSILSRGDGMADEEVIIAFTVAPQLGKWKDTVELGERIIRKERSLKRFRPSTRNPTRPDYKILWELAQEEVKGGNFEADPSSLVWAKYKITGLRYRLKQVVCPDETMVERLKARFSFPNWVEISDLSKRRLRRVGGVAQMTSISWSTSRTLFGPATSRSVKLRGVMRLDSTIETEFCRLQEVRSSSADDSDSDVESPSPKRRRRKRRKDALWEGAYIWTQQPAVPSEPSSRSGSPAPFYPSPTPLPSSAPTPAPIFAPSPQPHARTPSPAPHMISGSSGGFGPYPGYSMEAGRYSPAPIPGFSAIPSVRCQFEIQVTIRV